ncbi:MAG: hypothetical protein EA001_08200 [Oscillatoriales cyanobacterium]|nr:MAG: hypothetical protein EA001_08200 [Oscillatoriales cyanobacterium]
MVSEDRVKQYIALWMQLGKPVVCDRDNQHLGTFSVIRGQSYSPDFEQLWQTICQAPHHYHLAATPCSIGDLLEGHWDLLPCARCTLLQPVNESVIEAGPCPCQDLASWPDDNLPLPRQPINNQDYLYKIQLRLLRERALLQGQGAGTDINADINADINTDTNADVGVNAGGDIGVNVGANAGGDIGVNAGSDIGVDANDFELFDLDVDADPKPAMASKLANS